LGELNSGIARPFQLGIAIAARSVLPIFLIEVVFPFLPLSNNLTIQCLLVWILPGDCRRTHILLLGMGAVDLVVGQVSNLPTG
jgi:hypothetical protein